MLKRYNGLIEFHIFYKFAVKFTTHFVLKARSRPPSVIELNEV